MTDYIDELVERQNSAQLWAATYGALDREYRAQLSAMTSSEIYKRCSASSRIFTPEVVEELRNRAGSDPNNAPPTTP